MFGVFIEAQLLRSVFAVELGQDLLVRRSAASFLENFDFACAELRKQCPTAYGGIVPLERSFREFLVACLDLNGF
jgi:hypothetical protein